MKLTVNGEPKDYPEGTSLADLILELGLEKNPIAVEVNRAVVPRDRHRETRLRAGDRLEIVTLVGGG
jgi:thiamine biosynthesis protein ThiS